MSVHDEESETEEFVNTPPEMRTRAKTIELSLLPEKSRVKYMKAYTSFMSWLRREGAPITENVMLIYFEELSEKMAPPSLWSMYSRLKATIKLHKDIDIEEYSRVTALIKRKNEGYEPKSAKPLTEEDVRNFILLAPDEVHLATKVALIFGLMGALRMAEMIQITVDDVERHGNNLIKVKIPGINTKNKRPKYFIIEEQSHLALVNRYMASRPKTNVKTDRFFLNYQKNKCTNQPIGINKFRSLPKVIAEYLNLEKPGEYTGHCFRRTSTTILANAGANSETIKRHGGWQSDAAPKRYIEDSLRYKRKTASLISSEITIPTIDPSEISTSCEFIPVTDENGSILNINSVGDYAYVNRNTNAADNNVKKPVFKFKVPMFRNNSTNNTNKIEVNKSQQPSLSQLIVEEDILTLSCQEDDIIVNANPKECNQENVGKLSSTGNTFVFNNCNVTMNVTQ